MTQAPGGAQFQEEGVGTMAGGLGRAYHIDISAIQRQRRGRGGNGSVELNRAPPAAKSNSAVKPWAPGEEPVPAATRIASRLQGYRRDCGRDKGQNCRKRSARRPDFADLAAPADKRISPCVHGDGGHDGSTETGGVYQRRVRARCGKRNVNGSTENVEMSRLHKVTQRDGTIVSRGLSKSTNWGRRRKASSAPHTAAILLLSSLQALGLRVALSAAPPAAWPVPRRASPVPSPPVQSSPARRRLPCEARGA